MKFVSSLLFVLLLAGSYRVVLAETPVERGNSDAQRDAKKDVNALELFVAAGAGTFACTGLICVANDENNVWSSLDQAALILPASCLFISAGGITGRAIFQTATPRADRFLGKSADYINAYTKTYSRSVKRRRVIAAGIGCLLGLCSIPLLRVSYQLQPRGWVEKLNY